MCQGKAPAGDHVNLCIEDPFELTHNLGRMVDYSALYYTRGEMMRAFKLLCNGESFDMVCAPYDGPQMPVVTQTEWQLAQCLPLLQGPDSDSDADSGCADGASDAASSASDAASEGADADSEACA